MDKPKHISFKAPMNDGKYYWTVRVFNTLKDMRWWGKHINKMASSDRMLACVNPYSVFDVSKTGRMRRKDKYRLGDILLCRKRTGSRIIAHECVHAAFRYVEEAGKKEYVQDKTQQVSAHEEAFCYLVGDLSGAIYSMLYELKII